MYGTDIDTLNLYTRAQGSQVLFAVVQRLHISRDSVRTNIFGALVNGETYNV